MARSKEPVSNWQAFWLVLFSSGSGVVVTLIASGAVPWRWWSYMSSAEQAAWVQAIGSVAAILVAVAVPVASGWWSKRAQSLNRLERSRNALLRIYALLLQLQDSLIAFDEIHDPENTEENPYIITDPHDGDFQKPIPALIATIGALDDLGPLARPLQSLMIEMIEMDNFMNSIPAIQRSGSPAFWLNNITDIRERVRALQGLSAEAVHAFEDFYKPMRSPSSGVTPD